MIDVRLARVNPDSDPGDCSSCQINSVQVVLTIEVAKQFRDDRRKRSMRSSHHIHLCEDCALKMHVIMGVTVDSFFEGRGRRV